MRLAIEQFRISIQRVKDLISLHNSLQMQVTAALDISDILRAAWVLAVSALDYYIHESVTLGMLEIHQGLRSEPQPNPNTSQSAFSRFQVSLGSAREDRLTVMEIASWIEDEVQKGHGSDFLQEPQHFSAFVPAISEGIASKLNSESSTIWLEYEIREKLGYQSFQKPDKIAEAIRYISDKKLWEEIGYRMKISQREAKETLSNIVDRRNKIAHEADIDPSYGIGNRWPIDESMVGEVVGFIERLAESIHQILQDE